LTSKIKAVILAAGLGTRMKPYSFLQSKTMITFLGKPLLAHHVDECIKNNITDFFIVCNKDNFESIKSYFSNNYSRYNFIYKIQDKQLGPVHSLQTTKQYLKDKIFVVKYGDSISKEDQIEKLLTKYHEDQSVEGVATLRSEKNQKEYGVAKFNSKNQLIKIVEKSKKVFLSSPSNYVNVGLCLLKGETFFKAVDKIGFKEVIPPIEYLLRSNSEVSYWITKTRRVDLARPHDISKATTLLINKLKVNIKAILFDIDNTLLKTKEIAKQADMAAIEIFSKQTSQSKEQLYYQYKIIVSNLQNNKNPEQRTRKYSYKKLAEIFKLNPETAKKAHDAFLNTFVNSIKPHKNTKETLYFLKDYKLAAITEDSKETTIKKLKSTELHDYFDLIITSDDDDINNMKPHKNYFTKVFREFNVKPQECIAIGDNYKKDLAIPKKLGCTTISFGNDKHTHYQIKDLKELLEIIKNITSSKP